MIRSIPVLRIAVLLIISASAAFSSGCAPDPWRVEPARDAPAGPELLVISRGNGYGLFGHAALRFEGRIFGFWLIDGRLTAVAVRPEPFFRLYNDYEERDVKGIEFEMSEGEVRRVRARLAELVRRPRESDPRYNVLDRNCVTGIAALLSPGGRVSGLPPVHTTRALERWLGRRFRIVAVRYYPSFRHRRMHEKLASGERIGREFLVPFAECDTRRYRCWRLVYTEDLRGGRALLRPLAGAANVAAGAAQAVKGLLGTPFGKLPDLFRGLYSAVLAAPELVGVPVRFAGKPLPSASPRDEGPPPGWEPERGPGKKKKGRKRPSAPGKKWRSVRGKRVRPPLSPSASSRVSR